ncbi:hypothetical protein ACFSTH_06140 [Paenibacillus yanchengensis]|uniref:Uncharacterized protein n=1 Tax=Paenibacillus yanchengensis TaxID=2035833 RepID=A0ABW4YH69_9BACL
MDVKKLKEMVIDKGLEEKSILGFWNSLNRYSAEKREDFENVFPNYDKELVSVYVNTVSLTMTSWPDEDYIHIVLRLEIRYGSQFAADYRMVFNLDGTIEDDYLTF